MCAQQGDDGTRSKNSLIDLIQPEGGEDPSARPSPTYSNDDPLAGLDPIPSAEELTSELPAFDGDPAADAAQTLEEHGSPTSDLAGLIPPEGFGDRSAGAGSEALPTDAAPAAAVIEPGGIEKLKTFSNQLAAGKETVPAAFPFSLVIIGKLRPEEREKLLDVLARADVDIREPDLEPQFEAGRLLIPRISEYAGVQIVQAMRAAGANFRLGPADSIFATEDTRTSDDEKLAPSDPSGTASQPSVDVAHDADAMPVTSEAALPQFPRARVLDTVMASAAINTTAVEAEKSSEFSELLEALQRELKYKALRRGGYAIVNFNIAIANLSSPTRYRVTVSGSVLGNEDLG